MTVKELKNFVNNISEEYDNKKIITNIVLEILFVILKI